jgi:hypothetical protein
MHDPRERIKSSPEKPERESSHLLVTPPASLQAPTAFPDVRDLIPPSLLPKEDLVQALTHPVGRAAVWCAPISTILSFIATSSSVRIDVVTTLGERRTVMLGQFQSITIWPGALYRIHEHAGELIRLQRTLRNAIRSSHKHTPPASGMSLFFPQPTDLGDSTTDILPADSLPGFEVRLIEGFTSEAPHFHTSFDEAYFNIQGDLTARIRPHDVKTATTFTVPPGGCLSIPRRTDHHVIGGSKDNKILAFYWPRLNGEPNNDWHSAHERLSSVFGNSKTPFTTE